MFPRGNDKNSERVETSGRKLCFAIQGEMMYVKTQEAFRRRNELKGTGTNSEGGDTRTTHGTQRVFCVAGPIEGKCRN